jgi:8-oxo-dGTP diphosphatase
MSIKRMVVGFLFADSDVLLVQKMKPEWQKGFWNGVGGKDEDGEEPIDAMVREFREETKIDTAREDWHHFACETGPDYRTSFFASRLPGSFAARPRIGACNDVGEPLAWRDTRFISQLQVVGNLRWLIPLAQDWRNIFVGADTLDDIKEKASW